MAAPGGRRALCDDIFHFLSPRRGSIAWSFPRGVGEQTVLAIALQSFPIPIRHLCRQLLLCPSQKPPVFQSCCGACEFSHHIRECLPILLPVKLYPVLAQPSSEGGGCCKTCGLGCFSVSVSLKQIHIHHIGSFQPYRPTGCQNET